MYEIHFLIESKYTLLVCFFACFHVLSGQNYSSSSVLPIKSLIFVFLVAWNRRGSTRFQEISRSWINWELLKIGVHKRKIFSGCLKWCEFKITINNSCQDLPYGIPMRSLHLKSKMKSITIFKQESLSWSSIWNLC